jgi:hypothetical protein
MYVRAAQLFTLPPLHLSRFTDASLTVTIRLASKTIQQNQKPELEMGVFGLRMCVTTVLQHHMATMKAHCHRTDLPSVYHQNLRLE